MKTSSHFTETHEGPIKHLDVLTESGHMISCPVIVHLVRKNAYNVIVPEREGNKLVYALPAGGRIVA